jgi:hypothetical protein
VDVTVTGFREVGRSLIDRLSDKRKDDQGFMSIAVQRGYDRSSAESVAYITAYLFSTKLDFRHL